jgi:hypothetical protein
MNSVTFDNIMKAMDAVDSMRHRENVLDTELSVEERDRILLEKLRAAYTAQGVEVSEDILKKGVATLNEKRFVYEPMKSGWQRALATLYVRRGKYAKRALIASVVIGTLIAVPTFISGQRTVARIEREAAEAKAFERIITKDLPDLLRFETERALRAAEAAGSNDDQNADINRANASAKAAITARNEQLAKSEIAKITAVTQKLDVVILGRKLASEAESLIKDATNAAKSSAAREAVNNSVIDLRQAVKSGNEASFEGAKTKLSSLVSEIVVPLTIKIVDRPKVNSGVWRVKGGDASTKTHYLVVEAVKTDGAVAMRQVRDAETDRVQNVSLWAVRVPESVYNTIATEKRATGFISSRDIGVKKAGSLEIEWSVPTTGAAITSW